MIRVSNRNNASCNIDFSYLASTIEVGHTKINNEKRNSKKETLGKPKYDAEADCCSRFAFLNASTHHQFSANSRCWKFGGEVNKKEDDKEPRPTQKINRKTSRPVR